MKTSYTTAIYNELNEELVNKLKDGKYDLVINYDTLEFYFHKCPNYIIIKIEQLRNIKGADSVLKNFRADLNQ